MLDRQDKKVQDKQIKIFNIIIINLFQKIY
jgi:hypothetical protein